VVNRPGGGVAHAEVSLQGETALESMKRKLPGRFSMQPAFDLAKGQDVKAPTEGQDRHRYWPLK